MTLMRDFFLFCSGAEKSVLKRTPTDVNKYAGIGATIFFTGVFAAIAAGYALSTIFESTLLVIIIALLWGLMIFNLDRFIVSTMKKRGSFWTDFASATPRIILAVLIAIVIARPLELKIFESEIEAELVQMQQELYKKQDELAKSRYLGTVDSIRSEIALLKSEIDEKFISRDLLVNEAIKEADGTGGSMRRNLGPIYLTKRAAADKAQSELDQVLLTNNALIASQQEKLNETETKMKEEINSLQRVSLDGFAARMEGLERASKRSEAIFIASIFITLLFITIETAPVVTKLILDRSPYDFVLNKHEQLFEVDYKMVTQKREKSADSNVAFDRETIDHKTKIAIQAEKELSEAAIKRRLEELKRHGIMGRGFLKDSNLFEGDQA